jgi:hypothetical protein
MNARSLPAPTPALLLKLAHDDAEVMLGAMLETMRADMLAWEDRRSQRRNRNRLAVLLTSMVISVGYPLVMLRVMHGSPAGAYWTTAIAAAGDILVTGWAYLRRY